MQTYTHTRTDTVEQYDEGLRSYMIGVYNHMMLALLITGLTSYFSAPFLKPLMATSWWLIFALLPLAFVLALSFGLNKMSVGTARTLFYTYAVSMGISLSIIFMVFTTTSIAKVFFITAATFAAASIYGYTTKRDLTSMGAFLLMGMIGLLIASLVNLFLASSMLSWVISIIGVLVFTLMTAFDSQKLKEEYLSGGEVYGFDSQEKSSIFGALSLYLNFVVLFQYLLSLLGQRDE